jgi:hypothetical protein
LIETDLAWDGLKCRPFTGLPDRGLSGIGSIAKIPHQLFESSDKGIRVGIRITGRFTEPGSSSQIGIARSVETLVGLVSDVAVGQIELHRQFVDSRPPLIERSLHLLGLTADDYVPPGPLGNGLVSRGLEHPSLLARDVHAQGCLSRTSVGKAKCSEGVLAASGNRSALSGRAPRAASHRTDWGTFGPSPLGPAWHPIEGTADVRQKGQQECPECIGREAVTYSNNHRRQSSGNRRSGSLTLHPYAVADVGLTPGELVRARTTDVVVVNPR